MIRVVLEGVEYWVSGKLVEGESGDWYQPDVVEWFDITKVEAKLGGVWADVTALLFLFSPDFIYGPLYAAVMENLADDEG